MAAPGLSVLLLVVAALCIAPVIGAVPRFGAVHDAGLFPTATAAAVAGLAPRWYMAGTAGTPVLPAQPFSANPRHLASGHDLGVRQASQCPTGQHTCAEANAPGYCCPDDRYCYLDKDWKPQCCALGVKCDGSLCEPDQLLCNRTSTTTLSTTITTTAIGDQQNVTETESYVTFSACCNRACGETSYSCEKAYGGQCCEYGWKCALSNQCIKVGPATPTPTASMSDVPGITVTCSASQISCAATDGGGCCDVGSICTFGDVGTATSARACAPDPALEGGGGGGGGLSTGAGAGIGIGVGLGAAIVIAAATWLCIRRRRRQKERQQQQQWGPGTAGTGASAYEMRQNGGPGGGRGTTGYSLPRGPWSDASGPSALGGRSLPYIGPDAVPGPFTDQNDAGHRPGDDRMYANANTPHTGLLMPDDSGRFVTNSSTPYDPDDVRQPVELGGRSTPEDGEREGERDAEEDGQLVNTDEAAQSGQVGSPAPGPYELVGSLPSPSPLRPDEASPLVDRRSPSPSLGDTTTK